MISILSLDCITIFLVSQMRKQTERHLYEYFVLVNSPAQVQNLLNQKKKLITQFWADLALLGTKTG